MSKTRTAEKQNPNVLRLGPKKHPDNGKRRPGAIAEFTAKLQIDSDLGYCVYFHDHDWDWDVKFSVSPISDELAGELLRLSIDADNARAAHNDEMKYQVERERKIKEEELDQLNNEV